MTPEVKASKVRYHLLSRKIIFRCFFSVLTLCNVGRAGQKSQHRFDRSAECGRKNYSGVSSLYNGTDIYVVDYTGSAFFTFVKGGEI